MKKSCQYVVITALVCYISMVVVNLMSLYLESPFHSSSPLQCTDGENSVYIPGAGFSGFFYTLGRLSSLRENQTNVSLEAPHDYYCFSSGCLALVTHLMGRNVDSALELAHESRNQFMSGNIGQYSIVGKFVDGILFGGADTDTTAQQLQKEGSDNCTMHHNTSDAIHQLHGHLSRINVITTSWNEANFPSQSIRRPRSVDQLKQMLIQTTWIPFLTGPSIFEGDFHNDGGFAIMFGLKGLQQNCYSLRMPWRLDLMSDYLNLFLSRDKAKYFWEEGLKKGLD